MDASKLRNSCICGNTVPYLECCGRFADPQPPAAPSDGAQERGLDGEAAAVAAAPGAVAEAPDRGDDGPPANLNFSDRKTQLGGAEAEGALWHAFRHGLHELSMALFPLRAIYQGYWDKLSKEDYPHDLLMEDPEYGRAVVENFFWDYFVQYSDARPILRTARELEGKDLRLAHDLMQWSYAPLWFYRVQERNARTAKLLNLGNQKIHTVHHAGRMPGPGEGVLLRILPFRGREYGGHAALVFESGPASARLDSLFRAGCRELGVKPSVTLRPDVHCEEWRRHGAVFLSLWRAELYDSKVGRPQRGSAPAGPFMLNLRDKDSLREAFSEMADAEPAGPGLWNLRHRGLKLARLEAKGSSLQVTLADPAFRGATRAWLTERLADVADWPDAAGEKPRQGMPARAEPAPNAAVGPSDADQDAWVHAPLDALNGQTPIQASLHDWGKRRLTLLLREMQLGGKDITPLKSQLGL